MGRTIAREHPEIRCYRGFPSEIEDTQEAYDKFMKSVNVQRRKDTNQLEKARVNVSKRIQSAIAKIQKAGLEELSNYLQEHIEKGASCRYLDPDALIYWNIKF